MSAPGYAPSIPAGGTATFGFTGTSPGTPAVPLGFPLNGGGCSIIT